jgi:ferredoxin
MEDRNGRARSAGTPGGLVRNERGPAEEREMSKGGWRVEVDHTKCMGTGLCAGTRPDRFQIVGGLSHPVQGHIEPDDELIDVADSCPTEAISIWDASGKLLAPEF